MEEAVLFRLALAVGVVGIFSLFFIAQFADLKATRTYELGCSNLDKYVRLNGEVIGVRKFDSFFIIEVAEMKAVDVVVFSDGKASYSPGQRVDVVGRVREFNGELEVVAEKIKVAELR